MTNGMNGTWTWIKQWWFMASILFGLGAWAAGLQAAVTNKADKDAVLNMARDIVDIKYKLNDMDERQRSFFCEDKPAWCR